MILFIFRFSPDRLTPTTVAKSVTLMSDSAKFWSI